MIFFLQRSVSESLYQQSKRKKQKPVKWSTELFFCSVTSKIFSSNQYIYMVKIYNKILQDILWISYIVLFITGLYR